MARRKLPCPKLGRKDHVQMMTQFGNTVRNYCILSFSFINLFPILKMHIISSLKKRCLGPANVGAAATGEAPAV
jgi:hypothetical protein